MLVGGPAVTANPEPLAAIADAFFIGEAEEQIAPLSQLLWELLDAPRRELLDALAHFPGIYVPGRSTLPVKRQLLRDLDAYPTTTAIFTPDTEFGDMFLMEISRGCGRGCRFCLAGYTYRPPRERSLPALLAQAKEGLRYRQRVGLVGAAISDYSRIDDLVSELRALDCKISVSSLRIKPLSERLVAALVESGTRTLTLAPEAGSERLRACINKGIAEDDILAAAELAQRYRFPALKLYFMVGLPGETREDIVALLALVQRIGQRYAGALSVNVSPFVPKAHTPFQWVAMAAPEVLEEHLALLREGLRKLAVEFKAEGVPWSRVQGVLSRGDRRLGDVLVDLPARVNPRLWQRALESHDLSEDEYLRARGPDEPLPWSVVDVGVSQNYLRAESTRAASAAAPCAACQESAR